MLKLCENGLNIDYMYETNSVLRKTAETEISDLTFWLRFGSVRVFINRNRTEIRFTHIPTHNYDYYCYYDDHYHYHQSLFNWSYFLEIIPARLDHVPYSSGLLVAGARFILYRLDALPVTQSTVLNQSENFYSGLSGNRHCKDH